MRFEMLEPRLLLAGDLVGDANEDGRFDQLDIVLVLEADKYMTGEPASWAEGDWNGDGRFDQRDLVAVLQADTYLQDPDQPGDGVAPKNVILIIGDGMGFEHVRAARMFLGQPLSFEAFPYQTEMTTASADHAITDSAAGGTAIATGVKVNNRVISQQIPGDGSDLTTMLEVFEEQGKSTGLVTNAWTVDATPATFGAHVPNRVDYFGIATDYFGGSRPNVLMGADEMFAPLAAASGYTVVTDRSELSDVAAQPHSAESLVYGAFANYDNLGFQDQIFDWFSMPLEADEALAQMTGEPLPFAHLGMPHLSEMTKAALDIVGQNEDGFFLMVESANIDKQTHSADSNRYGLDTFYPESVASKFSGISIITMETVELSNTVQTAVDWVESRGLQDETLVLVTADHETGGVVITADNGPGQYPDVEYTSATIPQASFVTYKHTAANVPIYATGKNAELFGKDAPLGKAVLDNTEIYDRVFATVSDFTVQPVAEAA